MISQNTDVIKRRIVLRSPDCENNQIQPVIHYMYQSVEIVIPNTDHVILHLGHMQFLQGRNI